MVSDEFRFLGQPKQGILKERVDRRPSSSYMKRQTQETRMSWATLGKEVRRGGHRTYVLEPNLEQHEERGRADMRNFKD